MASGRSLHSVFSMSELAAAVDLLPSLFDRAVVDVYVALVAKRRFGETPPSGTVVRIQSTKTLKKHPITEVVFEVVVVDDLPARVRAFAQVPPR